MLCRCWVPGRQLAGHPAGRHGQRGGRHAQRAVRLPTLMLSLRVLEGATPSGERENCFSPSPPARCRIGNVNWKRLEQLPHHQCFVHRAAAALQRAAGGRERLRERAMPAARSLQRCIHACKLAACSM